MVVTIFIALVSLLALVVIHEFGHFILAKKFGMKVEEFGVGYPPKIFGKKIGETFYSINLIPFGAFVKILGETGDSKNPRSFSEKPFWQKTLVILGGVVSFWIVSAILLTVVMLIGAPTQIDDNYKGAFREPKVQVISMSINSPAEVAGIKTGDIIEEIKNQKSNLKNIDKIAGFQDFVNNSKGQEIILTVLRGKDVLEISLVPRVSPPEGEGPLGVALARTALVSSPWYKAPLEGIKQTFYLTVMAVKGWIQAITNLINQKPAGVEVMGPVGIFSLFVQTSYLGVSYFLQLIAIISVFVALFNILPIPATDGGKLLFIIIEKIKGKPMNQKVVQNVEMAFFSFLIIIMVFVTIKDIRRIF